MSFEEGDAEQALVCFRQALAKKPDLSDAYNNMGNALKELGRFEEATAAYERALELDARSTGLISISPTPRNSSPTTLISRPWRR